MYDKMYDTFWLLVGFALIVGSIFANSGIMTLVGLVITLLSNKIMRQSDYIQQLESEVDHLTDEGAYDVPYVVHE